MYARMAGAKMLKMTRSWSTWDSACGFAKAAVGMNDQGQSSLQYGDIM